MGGSVHRVLKGWLSLFRAVNLVRNPGRLALEVLQSRTTDARKKGDKEHGFRETTTRTIVAWRRTLSSASAR